MIDFRPKYITFDCYGTLTHFQMSAVTRGLYADRVDPDRMEDFLDDFEAFRIDEVMGAYQPYPDVVKNALRRANTLWDLEYRDTDGDSIVDAVPTWGPHPDVPEGLAKLAEEFPLVILSNAADSQIAHNVGKLGAPFHAVFTAEQARAYKPRLQAFEYMLGRLECGPGDVLHVSSSLRYDLIPAHDLRITNKVYLNRGYEPSTPYYGYTEITALTELPGLLGL
ncbi:haloacid dehalogenase type II [Streptomyces sp. NBC_01803]|uniref:haloacid dehalogenase type II n=1 Tax=Streptomyces sp. NBC_01803 TaxID=2975946 RepID=UPI002DDB8A52|nr:haloacid dehalogenase type II [Streptomyces sp. NBC_01803]WSA43371.1 haloacid dehalogenase type II [Streptomyces sp. NBC_01803]